MTTPVMRTVCPECAHDADAHTGWGCGSSAGGLSPCGCLLTDNGVAYEIQRGVEALENHLEQIVDGLTHGLACSSVSRMLRVPYWLVRRIAQDLPIEIRP